MLKYSIYLFLLFSFSMSQAADYICPNEFNPGMAMPIFDKSNHGAYVSVGSDRAFIGAALTRAEALYVVDIDPDIITFAKINRALLAASIDKVNYFNLRYLASFTDWSEVSKTLSVDDQATLQNPDSWDFWDKYLRTSSPGNQQDCGVMMNAPTDQNDPFSEANYIFDDLLFSHLQKLARSGAILTSVIDLTNKDGVQGVIEDISKHGFKLGVLDTSNVIAYVGSQAAVNYILQFDSVASPDTIYLQTRGSADVLNGLWHYFAFSSRYIRGLGQQIFLNDLENYQNILPFNGSPRIILDDIDYRMVMQPQSVLKFYLTIDN